MATQAISIQAMSQISFAARSERAAKWGLILGGLISLPAGFMCSYFGITAAAIFPGINPALALPTIVTHLSPVIGGVFLAALWAADISTAVGLLMGCSTLVMEDVVKRVYKNGIKPSREMLVSRIATLMVSLFAFLLALTASSIVQVITTALAMMTAFSILILASIYFPRLCKRAAGLPMMVVSLLLWVFWAYGPTTLTEPFKAFWGGELVYPEWVFCLIIFALAAVFGKEPAGRLAALDTD
jgi:SSS family solute:Na+ symporter